MSDIDTSAEAARSMGVTAVSAIVDEFGLEKRALRLHFNHDVTDQDRADLLAAINLWQSRSSHAADRTENARLRGALEPFAKEADEYLEGAKDTDPVSTGVEGEECECSGKILVGDFRRARAALSKAGA